MKSLILLAGMMFLLTGCEITTVYEVEEPIAVTEVYDFYPFHNLVIDCNSDISIRRGSQSVVIVSGYDDDLHSLDMIQSGKTLYLDKYSYANLDIEVTTPYLENLQFKGSGDHWVEYGTLGDDIKIEHFGTGSIRYYGSPSFLDISVDGPGYVNLDGRSDYFEARTYGMGSINGKNYLARDAYLYMGGSGLIQVGLDALTTTFHMDGSGTIKWSGRVNETIYLLDGPGKVIEIN